jgi:glyoxylase I family protein
MLDIEILHHVSLSVTDLERAKRFYEDILGLQPIERPPFDFPGAWYRVGESQQLHLIVHDRSTFRTGKGMDTRDGHFAIRVRSYRATLDYLHDQGYSPDATDEFMRLVESPRARAGFPQIYLLDPDRNIIELNAARLDTE